MHTSVFGQRPARRAFLPSLFLFFVMAAQAQTFVPKVLPGDPFFDNGLGHWADIDNDGDLDYITAGLDSPTHEYFNEGGVFTYGFSGFLPVLEYATPMGDFNQDGLLDILSPLVPLFNGKGKPDASDAFIFPFDGCHFRYWYDTLQWCSEPARFNSYSDNSTWGDDDNDGDIDMLYSTVYYSETCSGLKLFRWDKGTLHEAQTLLQTDTTAHLITDLFWEDFDRDGDLDVLLRDKYTPRIFRNQQGWYEELKTAFGAATSVRWADFDNDGDLDIAQIGYQPDGAYDHQTGLEVYFYEKGSYSLKYSDYKPRQGSASYGHTEVGDVDNNGDVDVITFVNPYYIPPYLQIYHNQNGTFIPADSIPIKNYPDTYTLADYDRDGDLDLTNGRNVLSNTLNRAPVLPSVPTGLASSVTGHDVTFSWQPANDARYPSAALTYNVHILTSANGLNYLNGMSHLPTGKRNILRRGNAGALTSKTLKNLPDGTYSWMVQAIDPNYNASAYSAPQSFTIVNGVVANASIALGTLQWLNTCECNEMVMEINPSGTFGEGNHFLLQLSDSTGSFTHPTQLFDHYFGAKPGLHNGIEDGKIAGWLPRTVAQGTHYRVRVASTNPARVSADNGYDIAVKKAPQLPGLITTAQTTLCVNSPDTQFKLNSPALYANYYAWDIQPSQAGVITGNGLQATVNWDENYYGPVQIRVKGVNGCGGGNYGISLEVFIQPLPSTTNAPRLQETICPGKQDVRVEVDSAFYAESYQWTLPVGVTVKAGTPINQKSIRLNFADNFTGGTLEVAARSVCGLGPPSQTIIELPGPIAKAEPIEGLDTLCASQGWANFTVPAIAHATQYVWALPDGLTPENDNLVTSTNRMIALVANRLFTGTISVAGKNDCFTGESSLPFVIQTIQPPATPDALQGSGEVCPGKTVARYQVGAVKGAETYEWVLPTGMQTVDGNVVTHSPQLLVSSTSDFRGGSLRVRAINRCGNSAFSQDLQVNPLPFLPVPQITQTCNTLTATIGNYPLQWLLEHQPMTSATHPDLQISRKGVYTVRVFGPCDTLEASLAAEPVLGNADEIPNAFTPNGDESNEQFELMERLRGSQLLIYNRWGELVYQSENYQNDWRGQGQSMGVYYYYLTNACLTQPVKGMISLLR